MNFVNTVSINQVDQANDKIPKHPLIGREHGSSLNEFLLKGGAQIPLPQKENKNTKVKQTNKQTNKLNKK